MHAAVAERRGAAGLAAELLVGADPVAALVAALEARLGGVATLCADASGGALLGVRWRPQVRLAMPCRAGLQCPGGLQPLTGTPAFVKCLNVDLEDTLYCHVYTWRHSEKGALG